jgi:hypothetical protein
LCVGCVVCGSLRVPPSCSDCGTWECPAPPDLPHPPPQLWPLFAPVLTLSLSAGPRPLGQVTSLQEANTRCAALEGAVASLQQLYLLDIRKLEDQLVGVKSLVTASVCCTGTHTAAHGQGGAPK